MNKSNLVDMQAAINDGEPMWVLVAGDSVKTMPINEACLRLEKGFLRTADQETKEAWKVQVEKEKAAAEAAAPPAPPTPIR